MPFKPTKKRQKQWIKDHLNGGVCASSAAEHAGLMAPSMVDIRSDRLRLACYDAMEWLDSTDIKTLAEAWDQCHEPGWLVWILCWMKPDGKDVTKARKVFLYLEKETKISSTWLESELVRFKWYSSNRKKMWAFHDLMYSFSRYRLDAEEKAKISAYIKELWGNPWVLK